MKTTADAVIFVLLDACRHDYLGRTRFLKQIASQSLVGQLEEPFGFCPRGAYFGGLTMAEQGYTHLFRYGPARSPFRWTRELAGTGADHAVGQSLHADIVSRARRSLPQFAEGGANPWGIPLAWQAYFDVSEREAPWSPDAGYRSIFHVLDDAEMPWLEVSWPFSGFGGRVTDSLVAGDTLRRLDKSHRFAFVHLPSLDAAGHEFGPGSKELQQQLTETDRLCELISTRALELFRDPVLLFAGDHGMVPVVRTVDVAAPLLATGLRVGHDVVFFIDSTMVRCWFFTAAARHTAMAAVASAGGGRWLSPDDRRRWQIDGIDSRNGEEYFLADPGVVFSPSFFDWTGAHPPRGMHGYAPEVADNRALFLAHRPRQSQRGDVGVVQARRLYPTFLDWLGFDAEDFTGVKPVAEREHAHASRWFVGAPASADSVVDAHLSRAVNTIVARAPQATSIVLAGGFGRGEGTPDVSGVTTRPANDYDIVVLGVDGSDVNGIGEQLAREFSLDFVDVYGGRSLGPSVPPKLGDFDLRYGARVLWGDPAVVERLGPLAPAELDVNEAAFLVGNRTGGMLLGLTGESATPGDGTAFRLRQTSKFLIAIADAWLIAAGDYSVSYAVRQRRFADLAAAAGFSRETAVAIDLAYAAKLGLRAGARLIDVPLGTATGALAELERLIGWDHDPQAREHAVEQAVTRHLRCTSHWFERATSLDLHPIGPVEETTSAPFWPSVGSSVYRAVRDVFVVWGDGAAAQGAAARAALASSFEGASHLTDADAARVVARLWLSLFH